MKTYPYRLHVALDGNGINGFEGMAGVCLFLYDARDGGYAYKIRYFDGVAAGHAVSVNPSGTVGFLGNASQQLLFYDARTLEELDRISTLRFETNDTTFNLLDDQRPAAQPAVVGVLAGVRRGRP